MSTNANLKANVHATGQHKDMPVFQRLKPLLDDHPAPCLSLYQPTYRAFPESQQNPVQYRNLLRELRTGRVETVYMWGRGESVRQEFRRIRAQ